MVQPTKVMDLVGGSPTGALSEGAVAKTDGAVGRLTVPKARWFSVWNEARAKDGAVAQANTKRSKAQPRRDEPPCLGEVLWGQRSSDTCSLTFSSAGWVMAPSERTSAQSGEPLQGSPKGSLWGKAGCIRRSSKSDGALERDGSGRISEDACGQQNPGRAKDPWGAWLRGHGENGPDMPNGQPESARLATRSEGDSKRCGDWQVPDPAEPADDDTGRLTPTAGHATLEPYWGKLTVRTLRGGAGDGAGCHRASTLLDTRGRRRHARPGLHRRLANTNPRPTGWCITSLRWTRRRCARTSCTSPWTARQRRGRPRHRGGSYGQRSVERHQCARSAAFFRLPG